MSLTANELNAAVKEAGGVNPTRADVERYGLDDRVFGLDEAAQEEADFVVPGIDGEFTIVTIGRDQLEPDKYDVIWQHSGGQHFGVFGYYDSWQGTTFDDDTLYEVEERTHEVKTWEVKKD